MIIEKKYCHYSLAQTINGIIEGLLNSLSFELGKHKRYKLNMCPAYEGDERFICEKARFLLQTRFLSSLQFRQHALYQYITKASYGNTFSCEKDVFLLFSSKFQ